MSGHNSDFSSPTPSSGRQGFPIVLSAPSGTGKTTIARRIIAERQDVEYSISATTRTPRVGEIDGEAYHFLSMEEFNASVAKGDFAEYALVHGNMYGTLRSEIERITLGGNHVIMDIDVQGAAQFASAFPDSVRIFILPPSGITLLERLTGRGTEDASTIVRRVTDALLELQAVSQYDYVVVNDDLDQAVEEVSKIIDAESLRLKRSSNVTDLVQSISRLLKSELHQLEQESSNARSHA